MIRETPQCRTARQSSSQKREDHEECCDVICCVLLVNTTMGGTSIKSSGYQAIPYLALLARLVGKLRASSMTSPFFISVLGDDVHSESVRNCLLPSVRRARAATASIFNINIIDVFVVLRSLQLSCPQKLNLSLEAGLPF
jgi:hypothetical protein